MQPWLSHPFDDDKLKEECGIFGAVAVQAVEDQGAAFGGHHRS